MPQISSEIEGILGELTDEEKSDAGAAVNEAGDAFVASKLKATARSLRAGMGSAGAAADSLPGRLDAAARLFEEERAVKRRLKDARAELDEKTREAIEGLDDDQARLLLSAKWIEPLVRRVDAIPDSVIDNFVDRLRALSDKYSTTYADIDEQMQAAEHELVGILGQLCGDEYDMAGIKELAVLLGGDAR